MENQLSKNIVRIPNCSAAFSFDRSPKRPLPDYHSTESFNGGWTNRIARINWKVKLGFNMENFTKGILDHVILAPKLAEFVKGKLRLGTRILQVGGVEKVFKKLFSVGNSERLLKACQCYLSTTTGKLLRIYYKVSIPLRKIKRAKASENAKKPSEKYIEVVTDDNFEVWFMGFLNHQKTLKYLQQLLLEAR